MAIRFYVDADLLALAKSLVAARYDVTFPGDPGDARRARPPCPILTTGTKDPIWIPQVAALGWVVLSRDRHILRKPVELTAVKASGLRLVVVDPTRDPTTWGELGIVVAQWTQIERLTQTSGPSVCWATRSTFRPVAL